MTVDDESVDTWIAACALLDVVEDVGRKLGVFATVGFEADEEGKRGGEKCLT